MNNSSGVSNQQEVKQIGIVLADLGKLNISVLKFLVLQINTLQQTFEFEFLPVLVEYDLFITKGLKPTPWESIQTMLQQEGIKQIIVIMGAIVQTI